MTQPDQSTVGRSPRGRAWSLTICAECEEPRPYGTEEVMCDFCGSKLWRDVAVRAASDEGRS